MANVVKYKKIGDINLQGAIELDALTASNVPNATSGKKTLFLDVADTTLKTKDSSGTVAGVGGSYTLPTATDSVLGGVKIGSGISITDGVISATGGASAVVELGTSGTQTIDRDDGDRFTLTPSGAVTLATDNFTDMDEATLRIIDGGTKVSFPVGWKWTIPTLVSYGFDIIKIQSETYNSGEVFSAYIVNSFKDVNRYPANILLHMNGSNDGTTFTDSGTAGLTFTPVGNVVTKTATKKFGTASAYFDGSGDYLTASNDASLNFGSGDWTIHCWVYANAATGTILGTNTGGSSFPIGIAIWGGSGKVRLGLSSGSGWDLLSPDYSQGETITVTQGQWVHVAVVRYGNNVSTYINGVRDINQTISGAIANVDSGIAIGRWYSGDGIWFNGYIDEFIIIKGTALWTANFTPPTAERD